MNPEAIATFLSVGLLSPVLAWLASIFIAMQKNRRAYVRLREAPIVFPGSHFSALYENGVLIMSGGKIQSLEKSAVTLVRHDGSHRMVLTCAEFEAMHPHWTTSDDEIARGAELGNF